MEENISIHFAICSCSRYSASEQWRLPDRVTASAANEDDISVQAEANVSDTDTATRILVNGRIEGMGQIAGFALVKKSRKEDED